MKKFSLNTIRKSLSIKGKEENEFAVSQPDLSTAFPSEPSLYGGHYSGDLAGAALDAEEPKGSKSRSKNEGLMGTLKRRLSTKQKPKVKASSPSVRSMEDDAFSSSSEPVAFCDLKSQHSSCSTCLRRRRYSPTPWPLGVTNSEGACGSRVDVLVPSSSSSLSLQRDFLGDEMFDGRSHDPQSGEVAANIHPLESPAADKVPGAREKNPFSLSFPSPSPPLFLPYLICSSRSDTVIHKGKSGSRSSSRGAPDPGSKLGMGASQGKKKAYNIEQQSVKSGRHMNGLASAYADIQWEQPHQPELTYDDPLRCPRRNILPVASYAPYPDYAQGDEDLIKPKKLINPVKASKSHQELHRELLMNHKRGVENKPELQRVLEQRKRDQMIKQRKQEEEARRKISPLEQELLKRHKQLEELEQEQERQEECSRSAPEFVKVKENLRRTSVISTEEKEV